MRVAVAADGDSIDSQVDPRFGRCPFYVVVDPETMSHESMANPGRTAAGGAGMVAAQALVKAGVSDVIARDVGPNAMTALEAAGIGAYTTSGGTVADAVKALKEGALARVSGATVSQHHGMRQG